MNDENDDDDDDDDYYYYYYGRPACCQADVDTAARCCAQTFESIGLLPQCCDNDRVRPICCKRPDGSTQCCPANFGYCCGQV